MTTSSSRRADAPTGAARRRSVAGSRERARRTLEEGVAARSESAVDAGPVAPAPDEVVDRPPAPTGPPDQQPTPDPGPAAGPGRPFRRGWPMVVGLVLLAVLVSLGVTVGLLAAKSHEQQQVDRARDQALAAARNRAQDFLSYDYRTLDRDFARARAGLTGSFAGEYAKTTQSVVRPTATQYQAVVKADVIALSVVDASSDQVVVLAFVDQTTTSTRLAGPKVDQNRVRMTLVPVRGQWKVSAVDAL